MKKLFTLFIGLFILSASAKLRAQAFSVQYDTLPYNYNTFSGGVQNANDEVDNESTIVSDSIIIQWKVIASDIPSDWVANIGICDNLTCYGFSGLWPSGILKTTNKYPDGLGAFHLQASLSSVTTTGTYYVTVRLYNSTSSSDSATETYLVTKGSGTAVSTIIKSDELLLYPNPANSELNLVYDANADVKTIAVYNIIGKVMTVYKVTDNTSANLNIDNLTSGIYFVRLMNSHGDVVVTKKFTKQ